MKTKNLIILLAASVGTLIADDHEGWTKLFDPAHPDAYQTEGNWLPQDDGSLYLEPRDGEEGWKRYGSYLWTKEDYTDFVCELEYKTAKDGNSGFYFRVADVADPVTTGVEVQILDCYEKGKIGWHDLGGIIKLQKIKDPAPLANASKKPGEWHQMRVTLKDSKLTVEINGTVVQDAYDLSKNKPQGPGLAATGKIGIQDHGLPFWVRNVRIKRL